VKQNSMSVCLAVVINIRPRLATINQGTTITRVQDSVASRALPKLETGMKFAPTGSEAQIRV